MSLLLPIAAAFVTVAFIGASIVYCMRAISKDDGERKPAY